jgi:AraC family transcriptional regulator
MDGGRAPFSQRHGFFGFRAPRASLAGWRDFASYASAQVVILDLERRDADVRPLHVDGAATPIIPFPHAHLALAASLTGPPCTGAEETLELLLPRRTFDQLADRQGATRIGRLAIEAGIGADDMVLLHLGACLEHALAAPAPAAAAVDQIAASATAHVAQRYGGLQPPAAARRGGLAVWQLRLAWTAFDRRLDSSVSLDEVARECGLSVSHFSRAFRRSTGLAPHRWLLRRRIEVAKDLMLSEPMPLAQVAVACGFADQSHFTRTFSGLIGLTPARWRADQARELAFA